MSVRAAPDSGPRWALRAILLTTIVGVAAAYVTLGAAHPWDFETYYYAASAYGAGLNPYSLESLAAVAGKPVELPFLYPPITLLVFLPLTHFSVQVAATIWLGFKCLLVAVLLWVWRRDFLRHVSLELLLAVALLGFNLAMLWDLRTGNAALVEEALLWLAFSAYVHGRRVVFVCLVALASTFKIYPILFLSLALVPSTTRRGNLRLAGTGLAMFLVLVALPIPASGQWVRALAGSLTGDRPIGDINPSGLGLIDWLLAAAAAPRELTAWLAPALYAFYCLFLLSTSGPVLRRAQESGSRQEVVVAAVLLWLLLAPRVMVYSYVMAVVPSLAVVRNRITAFSWRAVAVGLMLMQGLIRLLPGKPPVAIGALSFFLVLGVWLICGRVERASTRLPSPPGNLA